MMRIDPNDMIRTRYADLLDQRDNDALCHVVRELDAHHKMVDPGPWLPGPPRPMKNGQPRATRWARWGNPFSYPSAWLFGLLIAVLLSVGIVVSADNILNLGKPTSNVSPAAYFPLSGFHRIGTTVHAGSRTEMLVISDNSVSSLPFYSTYERWAIAKALTQFGTLSNTQPVDRPFVVLKTQGKEYPQPPTGATIDWSGATYRSRYLNFVHRDLFRYDRTTETNKPFQKLSKSEHALYRRMFARRNPKPGPGPLVVIANYAQTGSQVIISGDFLTAPGPSGDFGPPLSYDTIQSALVNGKDPPLTKLVEDVNGEANIMVALVCHADGHKPAKVCGRPAIRQILTHVK